MNRIELSPEQPASGNSKNPRHFDSTLLTFTHHCVTLKG